MLLFALMVRPVTEAPVPAGKGAERVGPITVQPRPVYIPRKPQCKPAPGMACVVGGLGKRAVPTFLP